MKYLPITWKRRRRICIVKSSGGEKTKNFETIYMNRISRRKFLKYMASTGATFAGLSLAGCIGQKEEEKEEMELSDELNVYNWFDYIGETTIQDFEKEYGVKVNYDMYASTDELFAKLQGGATGYDICVPTDYMIPDLIELGLIEPLKMEWIPNFKNISEKFANPKYDRDEAGNKYSVPWQWGTTGIGYNTEKVTDEVEGWEILWNEKYKDRITMLGDMRELFAAALKYLGYSLNTTDEDKLIEAKEILVKQKPLVKVYTAGEHIDMLASEDSWLSHIWSGDAYMAAADNPKVAYIIPKQGGTLWVDNMCIPKNAPHYYTAHVWMDFCLRPEVSAGISNYVWYGNPNKAAEPYINPEILEDPSIYPPPEVYERLEIMDPLPPETMKLLNRLYTEIMGK